MTVFEKALKTLKITKFCGEIRTKDGTFLIADGEFDVGVSLSVQTSEGIKTLPDGTYTLDDGRIIQVVKGKIKEIVEPLVNEPGPNPLETPPWVADGAIGLVGGPGGIMAKQTFQDTTATIDNTQTTVDPNQLTGDTQATDTGVTTMTLEEVTTAIKDLTDRITKLEGDGVQTSQEMKNEILKMSEFFNKNTPVATSITQLDDEDVDEIKYAVNPKILAIMNSKKHKKNN